MSEVIIDPSVKLTDAARAYRLEQRRQQLLRSSYRPKHVLAEHWPRHETTEEMLIRTDNADLIEPRLKLVK
mgnify:FL=1